MKKQLHNGITWIDIGGPTRAIVDGLANDFPFHPFHLEESLLTGHLPQVEKEKDYLFILLQVPDVRPGGKLVSDQVAIFLGSNYLVTIHNESVDQLRKLFDITQADESEREAYFNHSSSYLLYRVLDGILGEVATTIQDCLADLDRIEGVVFDDKVTASYEIGQLRQKITKLRRLVGFLNAVLGEVSASVTAFSKQDVSRHYRSIAKTVAHLSVALEEAKETVEIFKDADFTASTSRTNEVLSVLTIIFTLTIPATIFGTFYGMNIHLPGGLEAGTWTFWGPYTTLILVLGISSAMAGLMAIYFWKKKWF